MKTFERFFVAASVMLGMTVFNACVKDEAPILPDENAGDLVEMTFEVEAAQDDVKSTFTDMQLGWELTDEVAVYDGSAKRRFRVVEANGATATIKGYVEEGAADYYAVFPYSAAGDELPSEGQINIVLPKEQSLEEGKNFDEDAFIAIGKVDQDGNIAFKNAASLLKVHIPADVTSVKLFGNSSETLSGAAKADITVAVSAGSATSIEMTPSGATFSEGEYYMALLPTTFEAGFRVVYVKESEFAVLKTDAEAVFPVNGGLDATAAKTPASWKSLMIASEEELLAFVADQAPYADVAVKLKNNIALTKDWAPVDLTGSLDGQGYTISGLNVVNSQFGGLFATVKSGATLKNLSVEGSITFSTATNSRPAGLVGKLSGGTLSQVINRTSITAESSAKYCYLGGVVGFLDGGSVLDCRNEGNLTLNGSNAQFHYAGGVVGVIYPDGLVQGCVNTGTVTAATAATNGLGGIVGVQQSGETISCVNEGKLVANAMRYSGTVGGVVGLVYNNSKEVTRVHKCDNKGVIEVAATEFRAVGGVVGGIDDAAAGCALAEILECRNMKPISVTTANAAGTSGLDGFYLGGILGSVNAANASVIQNTVKDCVNSGNLSATTTGANNSIKVGGICGNTRGTVLITGNENSAEFVNLESTGAAKLLCAVGGIVGESGDPWSNEETMFTMSKNINRASVLSGTNIDNTPAGGLIGYAFCCVASNGNVNFGDVERAAAEGCQPSSTENCSAGGLVGFFRLSTEGRLASIFDSDMTFGNVTSLGRAGMLFGMVRSDSFADLKFPNCVVGGHLKSPVGGHDLDMTADNLTSNADLAENSYLWGYFPKGHVGLEINGVKFGNASDYDK
ncbi:MAG: hypothetical protein IKB85_03000 [Bacteroidales bacterium]|nr:hypothetical protein [Bacteroidales bacterium]